jgi:hypothetical protein
MFGDYFKSEAEEIKPFLTPGTPGQASMTNNVIPYIIRNQPDYSHIRLSKITLDTTLDFAKKLVQCQHEHKIKLQASVLVIDNARYIMQAHDDSLISDEYFLALSNEKILEMLQEIVKPVSKSAFIKAMRYVGKIVLPDNYRADPFNFKLL